MLHASLVMQDFSQPWWVAGGWAIDLYLGYQSRSHQDIDIAILRRDQSALRSHLHGWHFTKVVNSVSSVWPEQEHLALPVHEIYAENGVERLEFLLNEAEGQQWLFRRNLAVTAAIERITRHTSGPPSFFRTSKLLI